MKITIDASCLLINRYSGLAEVVHNLLLDLPSTDTGNQFSLFINYFRNKIKIKDIFYPGTVNHFSRIPRRLTNLWWKFGWPPIDSYLPKTDIYHSLHIQIPPTSKMKTVLTVHDCRFLALPELYKQREVENYEHQMKTSLNRTDMVVAVSEFTRREILTYFSFPEDRIRVIHNGFSPHISKGDYLDRNVLSFIEKIDLPQTYLLYVGALDPRKNFDRLIEAIALCREETRDFPDLLIVGVSNEQWAKTDQATRAKELGLLDSIHLCGSVAKGVLAGLTKNALALCYPSLYEGFGFPPLEAMALGVPVLAGKRSAIPEVAGHAACLVDPMSVDEIAQGLNRIVYDSDYRQHLIESGCQQVKKFSWRKAAGKYINLYKETLNS